MAAVSYYAISKATGKTMSWQNVTDVTYSDETVYDGDLHSFEFPATGMIWGGAGTVQDASGTDVAPDSVSKTDPRSTAKKRSIITLTVTHDLTTKTIKVFRDELVGGCLLNVDPDA